MFGCFGWGLTELTVGGGYIKGGEVSPYMSLTLMILVLVFAELFPVLNGMQ